MGWGGIGPYELTLTGGAAAHLAEAPRDGKECRCLQREPGLLSIPEACKLKRAIISDKKKVSPAVLTWVTWDLTGRLQRTQAPTADDKSGIT